MFWVYYIWNSTKILKNLQIYRNMSRPIKWLEKVCKVILTFKHHVLSLLQFEILQNFNEFTDLSESVSTNQMTWKSLQSYFKTFKIDSFLSAVQKVYYNWNSAIHTYNNYNEFTKSTTNSSFFIKLFEYSFKKNSKSSPKDKT